MTVLPNQKLTIGELFVSLAAGLMFFLLPNDARNQFESPISECYIAVISIVITLVLYFIIKRFESLGAAMLTTSVLILTNLVVNIAEGIFSQAEDYWPTVTEYNIISMFIVWFIPFFCMTASRLIMSGSRDNNDNRMGFSRFLMFSMRALLILYAIVIIFKLILPYKPNPDLPREIEFGLFSRISDCMLNIHDGGIKYILWHSLILVPMSFYLLILIPKISWWQILIIALAFGLTIEVLQYSFNTGIACTDDILMYIVGAVIGILLKHLIDKARSILTSGQDDCMLSLDYSSIKRKNSNNAFVITE